MKQKKPLAPWLPGRFGRMVNQARRPYPKPIGNEKWLVVGPLPGGQVIQVIYLVDEDEKLFVIHARPLSNRERKRHRRNS